MFLAEEYMTLYSPTKFKLNLLPLLAVSLSDISPFVFPRGQKRFLTRKANTYVCINVFLHLLSAPPLSLTYISFVFISSSIHVSRCRRLAMHAPVVMSVCVCVRVCAWVHECACPSLRGARLITVSMYGHIWMRQWETDDTIRDDDDCHVERDRQRYIAGT